MLCRPRASARMMWQICHIIQPVTRSPNWSQMCDQFLPGFSLNAPANCVIAVRPQPHGRPAQDAGMFGMVE